MREILFKGKRIDTGEWIEGNLITDEEITEKAYIGYLFGCHDAPCYDVDVAEVDPSTVCQYTGLTNVNGKRIFEGDILSVLQSDLIGECIHIEDYIIKDITDGKAMIFLEYANELEITGNIYDNPELLKEHES